MNCPKCNAYLLVEIFGTSNPIRCASCGCVSVPPNQAATQVNRFAWRSFWLGLSSILLLFLTGIPAIWYGVRSLLQMRFTRSQKSDRKAAIAGVSLGVIFGILGTGLVAVIGGVILLVMMAVEETDEPQRMQEILATVGSIEVPETFQMVEAERLRGQFRRINWRDGYGAENTKGRIRLIRAIPKTQVGEPQINIAPSKFTLHSEIEVDSEAIESEELTWRFAGEDRTVIKTTSPAKEGDFRLIKYVASTKEDQDKKVYLLLASIRVPGKHTEEEIRKVFESFIPAD